MGLRQVGFGHDCCVGSDPIWQPHVGTPIGVGIASGFAGRIRQDVFTGEITRIQTTFEEGSPFFQGDVI